MYISLALYIAIALLGLRQIRTYDHRRVIVPACLFSLALVSFYVYCVSPVPGSMLALISTEYGFYSMRPCVSLSVSQTRRLCHLVRSPIRWIGLLIGILGPVLYMIGHTLFVSHIHSFFNDIEQYLY